MPLKLVLAVRDTVAGQGALQGGFGTSFGTNPEGGGGGGLPMHPCLSPTEARSEHSPPS